MSGVPVLSVIVLAPLAGAALIGLLGRGRGAPRYIALAFTLVSLVGAAWLYWAYDRTAAGFQFVETVSWIPSMGVSYTLGVDGVSVPMLLLTAIVIVTGVLASWSVEERPREFFVLLLLLVSGVFGVFASLDAFLLFFFYEMAVLPMYLLISIWGSTRKDYAAMKLTLFLFAGSAALMLVLVVTYWNVGAGTFDMRVWAENDFGAEFQRWMFLLALIGFGTLIPTWPLHTWSPDGHVAAPTAVSMLHAGVLLKLGAYGVIRLGMWMFPTGFADWRMLIGVIGAVNVVYGAFCAMNQSDLKYVIGYSSVSHMGYVLLGLAVASEFGLSGAVFQMFAHGIMTALFFTLVGYVYESSHTRQIAEISGLMKQTPLVAAAFVVASAASMGLPSTSGFVAELLVYVGLVNTAPVLAAAAFVGVVITAAYLLRLLGRILLGEPSEAIAHIGDPSPIGLVPVGTLCLTIMVVGLFPASMHGTITSGLEPLLTKLAGG
ncbi:MAG: NADH-quinone oxidoreductase subunit M [Actinobacteria bacterium]|nr:MAG: NADH-quinone oxidoreductase subunit M [Actinomycetota bacterium]